MRKTKCKSCNGNTIGSNGPGSECAHCTDGEISVYTIQELREGKVWCKNDGTKEDAEKFLRYIGFPDYNPYGGCYGKNSADEWMCYPYTDRPTQSVKIFLEEIEQEEEEKQQYATYHGLVNRHAGFKANPIIEKPEYKWGEEVDSSMHSDFSWSSKRVYCCPDPINPGFHIVICESEGVDSYAYVRKPQKITLTLSQIAEKFNCKPEQIKIVE